MTFLETILAAKREEVAVRTKATPLDALKDRPQYHEPRRPFASALGAGGFGIIAELKKASPSRGVLRRDFDPGAIARSYTGGGAAALSVLTDERFFQGRLEHLATVREVSPLPLLRKDFVVDPYQIHEARAAGADAVLLIVAALDLARLEALSAEAASAEMDHVLEVHNEQELRLALALGRGVIGVNNRDLATFTTDLAVSLRLARLIPSDVISVAESGITSAADLRRLKDAGYNGALIGEAFMKKDDPGGALREFLLGVTDGRT